MLPCAHCNDTVYTYIYIYTGRIRLRNDPEREAPINLLAADPLTDPPSVETLTAALKRISAPIKVCIVYLLLCTRTVLRAIER
jgi:hypothetical protein